MGEDTKQQIQKQSDLDHYIAMQFPQQISMRNIRNQVIQEGVDTTYKNVDSQPDVLRDEKENFSKSVPTV